MQTVELLHEISAIDRTIAVKAHETLNYFFVLFADAPIERRLTFTLADDARVQVRGLIVASESADIRLTTDTVHAGKNTQGLTTVKGIVADRARANATGWIRILESGIGASAFLEQRFLLLSPKARAKAEPILEIAASDLKKAGHAASVSRLNDEQLFYCGSRGIDPLVARRLLIEGFMNSIIDVIPDTNIVAQCREYVASILS